MRFKPSHLKIFSVSLFLIFVFSCAYHEPKTPTLPAYNASPNTSNSTAQTGKTGQTAPSQGPSEDALANGVKNFNFSSKSLFRPVSWRDLPTFESTPTAQIWSDLLENCIKPHPIWSPSCKEMRPLTLADEQEQRMWMLSQLQAYRVESLEGDNTGLLTSYYEPIFKASLTQHDGFNYPIYAPPPGLLANKKRGDAWYSRRDIETLGTLQNELQHQALAWLEDPLDVMILHVQGSARLRIESTPGQIQDYRASFAASNDLPYQSIAKWMLDQGLTKDISWQGIRAALDKNPQWIKEALWSNPRYIFFSLSSLTDPSLGPIGAMGSPLKAHLSVAVDPKSIPLGMPLWLESEGSASVKKMVLSQDTGNAINGSIRADYFAGTGKEAGDFANKIKQNLKLWLILPRAFHP